MTNASVYGSRKSSRRRRRKSKRLLWLSAAVVLIAALVWWRQAGEIPWPVRPAVQEGAHTEPVPDARPAGDHPEDASPPAEPADGSPAENPGGAGTDTEQPDTETGAAEMDGSASFAFVGDVMMAGNVGKLVLDKGYDYPFERVGDLLREADFTAANLETPITDRGEPLDKQWVYRTPPDAVPAFVRAGIDLFTLANNHILDYGRIGLLDTFAYLEEASLLYVGAGRNEEQAFAPAIVDLNGIRTAFLGFSRVVPDNTWKAGSDRPGVAQTYDHTSATAAIAQAAKEADLVIVLAHWGDERVPLPNRFQVDLARRYIDAGADLVVGSHPHVLQGFERYKDRWIAYSLGNFVFTTNPNPKTWDSAVLQATCSKSGECELNVVPVNNAYAHPEPLDGDERLRILRELSELSLNAAVRDDGMVTPADIHEEWEMMKE
jgi:poly-gamma-glutamate synthesis protein (capsule biosynthesis protein)